MSPFLIEPLLFYFLNLKRTFSLNRKNRLQRFKPKNVSNSISIFRSYFITNLLYYFHNGGFLNIKQGLIIFKYFLQCKNSCHFRRLVVKIHVIFDVWSNSAFGHSVFGIFRLNVFRCSVFRCSVIRCTVIRCTVIRRPVFRRSVGESFIRVVH